MSTTAGHSLTYSAGGMLGVRFFAGTIQHVFAVMRAWQTRIRQRRELLMLNDVELRELSLTAADVNLETGKPFWKSVRLAGR